MSKIYKDDIFTLKQFELREDGDIFKTILEERENLVDSKRFFLGYLPQELANGLDNDSSLMKFRDDCLKIARPLERMGGCNLDEYYLEKGIRYSGIKMSDPSGKIYGTFNIYGGKIIYSPIFPHFHEERDLIKFANDTYFTTITFEEIMKNQIDLSKEFYVHIRDYRTLKELNEKGRYIFEKINKDKMLKFVSEPELGEEIFKKYLKIK